MATDAVSADLEQHLRLFFAGHDISAVDYALRDGTRGRHPGLSVFRIGPGPRATGWTHASVGSAAVIEDEGHGTEFFLRSPVPDERLADLVAMTADYQRSHRLAVGHSLPIGEPVIPGSLCDHLLVSLPYEFGPTLERCVLPTSDARFLWLLPMTSSEAAFRREHGTAALEQRFEDAGLNPLDLRRDSVA